MIFHFSMMFLFLKISQLFFLCENEDFFFRNLIHENDDVGREILRTDIISIDLHLHRIFLISREENFPPLYIKYTNIHTHNINVMLPAMFSFILTIVVCVNVKGVVFCVFFSI